MSIDDFIKQVEQDELEDKAAVLKKMTPIEYARARGIAPQKVYYNIRNHKLNFGYCDCGRKVIDIEEADTLFKFKVEKEADENAHGEEDDLDEEATGD